MTTEPSVLEQVARRYEKDGYTVIFQPHGTAVPAFASGLEIDLIAVKGDEHVVVEVKQTRSDIECDPHIARLAEIVNAQPDWRFDLVVLDAETPVERIAHAGNEPTPGQIREMLAQAEQFLLSGDVRVACILAWGALEATMREVRKVGELHGRIAPQELMRTLYSNGIFSREEFRELQELFNIRTQIVHGMVTPVIEINKIYDLLAITKKLLAGRDRNGSMGNA
jgi:Holliday junction resolvase-like predicted endonuclease